MKEFIEKLIERLEEQIKIEESIAKSKTEGYPITHQYASNCLKLFRNQVNQLAEEYNQENDDTDYANIELYAFWQKHQWIPCSERLPDIGERVFVWVYGRVCIGKRIDAKLFEEYDIFSLENGSNESTKRIDAWQPLPAPYQPKGE